MRYINPSVIGESELLLTNVPEMDAPLWVSGKAYVLGDEVLFNHRVYFALRNNTGKQPDISPLDWALLGASNRTSMFDGIVSRPTSNPNQINVAVKVLDTVNAVSFFGLKGTMLQLIVIDDIDGEVYRAEVSLVDNTQITDWHAWFFEPIEQRSDIVFLDLPNYRAATVVAVIDAPGTTTIRSSVGPAIEVANVAECGEMVVGNIRNLGITNTGTSVSIRDYSRKETDQFGNISVVERSFAKLADYDVTLESSDVARVQASLASIRAKPVVFIGDQNSPETVVYGFFRNFRIVLESAISSATIEVEGLV